MATKNNEVGFFDIDRSRLDEEWVNHPKVAFKYFKEYEDAKIDMEEANTELDIVSAQITRLIRKNPKKYGLTPKHTETAISKTIILRPKYKEALKVVRAIQYKLGLLKATVKALEHRKSALERLVSLHGQNYFSTPRATDEDSKEAVGNIEKGAARLAGKKRRKGQRK